MTNFHNKGLSFSCKQTLNDLKTINGSLNCSLCSKNIIDFRNKTKEEYLDITRKDKNICGIFLRGQVQKDLKLVKPLKNIIALTTFSYYLLVSQPLEAQSNHTKTEQLDSTDTNSQKSLPKESIKEENSDSSTAKKCEKKNNRKPNRHRNRLYFNRRFPFIHYGKNYLLGRVTPVSEWRK